MSPRTSRIVLRRTSVGCAVMTGLTSRSSSTSTIASGSSPASSSSSKVAARLPRWAPVPTLRWWRRRRSTCRSSAVFARSDSQSNARSTLRTRSIGCGPSIASRSATELVPFRRAVTATRRTDSISSKVSSPVCSRTTSPRRRPRSRMSSPSASYPSATAARRRGCCSLMARERMRLGRSAPGPVNSIRRPGATRQRGSTRVNVAPP